MSPILRISIRLFNALCFAVAIFGLLLLLNFTAESLDDMFHGFRPGRFSSWVLMFAPLPMMVFVLPVLGAIAHWRTSSSETASYSSVLWHIVGALLGGVAMLGGNILFLQFNYLNGGREVTIREVIGNAVLFFLFLAPVIWGPR